MVRYVFKQMEAEGAADRSLYVVGDVPSLRDAQASEVTSMIQGLEDIVEETGLAVIQNAELMKTSYTLVRCVSWCLWM